MSGRTRTEPFALALGAEIRAARKARKWTRRDLQSRLPIHASLNTIATWELGTRSILAARLVQIGDTLGVPAEVLIGRARARMAGPPDPNEHVALGLDVVAAAGTQLAALAPVQAWAACRRREDPSGDLVVRLDAPALDRLATLCQVPSRELTDQLFGAGLLHFLGAA